RIGRERETLVDARDALARRKTERTQELDRYLAIERERQASLRTTRRSARQALERLSELERDEKSLNDRIAALERARLEAEARGAAAAASITTADLGQLDWPVEGRLLYRFGTGTGPNKTRIPWHGIGIAAATGTPVREVAAGTVSLAGPLGTYLTSVLIDHGCGYYTFYGYLSDPAVAPGERVLKGQLVGHVGGGSSDQGPPLPFEIRGRGGLRQDQRALGPAIPRDEVGRADLALHHGADLAQHPVAGLLAEPLVDVAQPVHVDHDEREAQRVAARPLELVAQAAIEPVEA